MSLKAVYRTTEAFGFVDAGPEEKPRFAVVRLDINNNGVVDEAEKIAVKASLYTLALQKGGEPLDDNGQIIGVNSCVDFSNGGEVAQNDSAYVFNKGEIIALTTNYTDKNGNEWITPEDALTRLSFDALHWLEDNGFIEGV